VPAEDQGIEVWLGWNETTNLVYVGARVHDDAFATTTFTDPFNSWRSDDIEVVIDADGSAGLYDFEAATAQQYILNPGTGTPFLFPFGMPDPPDVDAAVSLSQNGDGSFTYQYELAIPGWSLIDDTGSGDRHTFTAGQIIGLALGFGDFESEADADAANYHAFGSLDGKVQAFFDANAMPGFELLAPGDEPPAAPLLVTDYDGSGATDFNDFFQFADGYGRLQDDPEFDATFDHDSNGDVNGADLFLFAENFGSAETPPVPEWIPGPNGGAQIHARYEETRIVITASGLSAATGALVLLDRDPEVAELGVATFVDNWPNMRLSRGSFVEIAATALGGTPIGGEVELASIEFTGDPGAIVPLNVVLRGPGLGERDVLSIEPPPPPIVPPHVLPGRTIVHVEPSDLPVIDGDVGDWEALLGPPLLTDVDFSSIAGTVFGPEVSPADQSIEVWLAWNQATNLLYIGDRRPGARQRVRHHHLHRPRQRLA
jgi:hypothetical protein